MRVAYKQPVHAVQRLSNAGDLGRGALSGKTHLVLRDSAQRGRRAVSPDRIDRVDVDADKFCLRLPACRGKSRRRIWSQKARVIAKPVPGSEVSLDPFERRIIDCMAQFEKGAVHLQFRLLGITPIDKQGGFVFEYDDDSR